MRHFLLSFALVALCGCSTTLPDEPARPLESVKAHTMRLRSSLRALRSHPRSALAALELDQAEIWLLHAETAADSKQDDYGQLRLAALEGQLAVVQARFIKLDTEEELKQLRTKNEARKDSVAQLQAALR